jgi:hypothetical protein
LAFQIFNRETYLLSACEEQRETSHAIKSIEGRRGRPSKKLFQFLNDIGARALRMQLGRVLEMAESSGNKNEYETKIIERFGGQRELELLMPTSPTASPPPS